ncbi:hypothetical protein LCGC14_1981770 [marine sediment metagenome]|uniref:Uncharacterized protein n=1 Tax=marine sediment metagenome TaxID=412755 RepID=A0A0F9I5Q5_9ZZZZ
MGTLYAWATKEYLLEKMSFRQIFMYLNYGIEFKYGKQETKPKKPSEMTAEEARAERDKLRKQYGNVEGL